MKRRDFLLTSGLFGAGSINLLEAFGKSEADSESGDRSLQVNAAQTRKVLVTSAHSKLAQLIGTGLGRPYQVRFTAPVQLQTSTDFVRSELNADESTKLAVRGVDAIVHVAEPPPDVGEAERIEYRTRCTYNLLQAAVQEGVSSVIYLSSLRMMGGYEKSFQVDEDWRPHPTPATGALADHLGEFTCREFAREGKLRVIVLRLGDVMSAAAEEKEAAGLAWVDPRDVAQAVSCALAKLLADPARTDRRWWVVHIRSLSPGSQFPLKRAQTDLGYHPNFGGQER